MEGGGLQRAPSTDDGKPDVMHREVAVTCDWCVWNRMLGHQPEWRADLRTKPV
jgi:hypothetical protein